MRAAVKSADIVACSELSAAIGQPRVRSQTAANAPLRILHVVPRLGLGGTENGVLKLLRGLDAGLFRQAICAVRGCDHSLNWGDTPKPVLLAAGDGSSGFKFSVPRIVHVIRQFRPHIVHSRNWGAIESVLAARLCGVPVVIHSEHGYELDMLAGLPLRRRLVRRAMYSLADAVFAVTEELRDFHARQARVAPSRMRTIYNGVDTDLYRPNTNQRNEVRRNFRVPESSFVVGTIGRMVAIKDHKTLILAVAQLLARGEDIFLVIVGDGPERQSCQRMLNNSTLLASRVRLAGMRHDVPSLLNSFDVFALPSLCEGMSNTVLEAMACGLPVIATAVGGNPELIGHGLSGTLVPARDPDAFACELEKLMNDRHTQDIWGRNARELAVNKFSLSTMLRNYSQLYLELAARKGLTPVLSSRTCAE